MVRIINKIITLIILLSNISCSSLVIRNEDTAGEVFGKVVTRLIILLPTFLWSEVAIREESLKYQESLRKNEFEELLKAYIGKHINSAVESYGYKYKEIKIPSGDIVYEFYFQSQEYISPSIYFQGNYAHTYGGYTRVYYCDIFFLTDNKFIKKVSYKGNNCY
jgi:hypothetical protein